jgi:4-amino-4-deoxy-L-arabinose transferase-like glycosyltransferase
MRYPHPVVSRAHHPPRYTLVILGFWLLLYSSFALFLPPLLDDADSVHAEAAREMIVNHNPVTLTADGVRYLEKAPLLYWLMAAFMAPIRGSLSDPRFYVWAARLPLALAVLLLAYIARRLGREMFGSDRAGFYAAIILLTSFGVFIFTRILIPDILLTLFISAALLFFWRTLSQEYPSNFDCLGIAAATALAVLTKGLIGFIFPVVIVFFYLACTRNLLHLLRIRPASQTVMFFLLTIPWHWAAALANPTVGHPGDMPSPGNVRGFAWFYFVNDQFARYVGRRVPHDYDTVPLLLFWGLLLVWMLPWSVFLFKALRKIPLWRALKREELPAPLHPWLFCGIWAGAVLVFFSFSTRQEYYVLPALPALALLIGAWLAAEHHASFTPEQESALTAHASLEIQAAAAPTPAATLRAGRRIALFLLIAGSTAAIFCLFLVLRYPSPVPGEDISALLTQHPSEYALSFGHFLDLGLRSMSFFRWPLLIVALALLAGTTGNFFFRRRNRPGTANMFLASMSAALLIASWFALVTFSPILGSRTLADAIKPELTENSLLVVNGEYEDASSLNFYLQRPLHILHEPSSDLWYGSFFPNSPAIWETPATIAAAWSQPRRIFLWTRPGTLPALPGPAYVIATSGGKQIVSNQPNRGGASF